MSAIWACLSASTRRGRIITTYAQRARIGGSLAGTVLDRPEDNLKEEFFEESNVEKLKGLNSVPMTITMKYLKPPIQDEAELSAGILGFEIHEKDTFNGVPSFQPYHAWALKLAPNSKIRG
eukprot:CAMPEP_0113534302 /NCGR_PEP_ID=MMETSP0015_2-20120614/5088_1 /TAXON_ID=2838 /ORGANISM="Odontella" /LENGTH=120 /DNA_ID=CAMNT_0000433457 /DNA_START=464 /DNA_END=827 /DNA_ORIENTATION=- /assembly_acc=CAM_ASM_000160